MIPAASNPSPRARKSSCGINGGKTVQEMPLPVAAKKLAAEYDVDVHLHKFTAAAESRDPRIVRFGVTQNAIIEPTDAPINDQYMAIQDRHQQFIEAAAAAGTNVLCFQEAWTMPFGEHSAATSAPPPVVAVARAAALVGTAARPAWLL